jgi:hypothetical protein
MAAFFPELLPGHEHARAGPRLEVIKQVVEGHQSPHGAAFVESESTFSYFEATASYLRRHGKPVAFYSDKHSTFRVTRQKAGAEVEAVTQFARALAELNIDIICANTPQAKGPR